jgi:hypothetical protein
VLKNGELLKIAEEAGYDVFVTTDTNLKYQQNLSNRRLAIVVLLSTSWPRNAACSYVHRCRDNRRNRGQLHRGRNPRVIAARMRRAANKLLEPMGLSVKHSA